MVDLHAREELYLKAFALTHPSMDFAAVPKDWSRSQQNLHSHAIAERHIVNASGSHHGTTDNRGDSSIAYVCVGSGPGVFDHAHAMWTHCVNKHGTSIYHFGLWPFCRLKRR